jgi:nitrogen regulatory protein P-II 1
MIKKIEAIIRPEKLEDVKAALTAIGIVGMNIIDVQGRGRGAGLKVYGRTGTYTVDMIHKVQINIILSDHNVDATVKVIKDAAYSGEKGDGMIFIYPVEKVVRISTGEEDSKAIVYQGDIDSQKSK